MVKTSSLFLFFSMKINSLESSLARFSRNNQSEAKPCQRLRRGTYYFTLPSAVPSKTIATFPHALF